MPIASFQMMNRCYSDSNMMVQGFSSVAIMCQEVRVVRQVPLKDCGQIVHSPMMDRLLVSGLPAVPLILLNGGAELLIPALPVTDLFCDAPNTQ